MYTKINFEVNIFFQLSIAPTELRLSDDYTTHYNHNLRIVFTGVIPLIALVYFNYQVYCAFKQRRRNMRGKNKSIIKVFIYIFPLCYTSMHRRYKERCKIVASSSSALKFIYSDSEFLRRPQSFAKSPPII